MVISNRLKAYAERFENSGAWGREFTKWSGNPVPLKETIKAELEYVVDWYTKNYNNLCTQFEIDTEIVQIVAPRPSNRIFTLDGRKVRTENINSLPKGLYIIDGRKILVK